MQLDSMQARLSIALDGSNIVGQTCRLTISFYMTESHSHTMKRSRYWAFPARAIRRNEAKKGSSVLYRNANGQLKVAVGSRF